MGNEVDVGGLNINANNVNDVLKAFTNDEKTFWRCPVCKKQVWAYAGYANGGPCIKCGPQERVMAMKMASDVINSGNTSNDKSQTIDEIADDVYSNKYNHKFQNNSGLQQFLKVYDALDVDQPSDLEELKEHIPLQNEINLEQDSNNTDEKQDKWVLEQMKDHFGLLVASIEGCKYLNKDQLLDTDKLLDDIPKKLNINTANYYCEYVYLYCIDFDYVGKLNRIHGRTVVTHYMHSGLDTFFRNAIDNNDKLVLWRHGGDEFVIVVMGKEYNKQLKKLVHNERYQKLLPFTSVMFEVSRAAITNEEYVNIRDLWDYVACGFYFLGALKKKGEIERGTSYIQNDGYKQKCIDNEWIKLGYKMTDTWYTVDDKLIDKFSDKLKIYEESNDDKEVTHIGDMKFKYWYWFEMQSLGKLNDKYGLSKADDELVKALLQCIGGKKYKQLWKLINVIAGGKFTFGVLTEEAKLYKPSNEYVNFVIMKQENKDDAYGKSNYDAELIFKLSEEKKFKPNNIYDVKYYQNSLNQLLNSE